MKLVALKELDVDPDFGIYIIQNKASPEEDNPFYNPFYIILALHKFSKAENRDYDFFVKVENLMELKAKATDSNDRYERRVCSLAYAYLLGREE